MSRAVLPLPYMLSCTQTTLPFSWSWSILLWNPPGRCQENCINMNTALRIIHRALSTQHTVSDPNFAHSQVTVWQLQCCLPQYAQLSLAVKWTPPTSITRHYTHYFFFCKFVKDAAYLLTPNIPQQINKKHMPKTDHDIPQQMAGNWLLASHYSSNLQWTLTVTCNSFWVDLSSDLCLQTHCGLGVMLWLAFPQPQTRTRHTSPLLPLTVAGNKNIRYVAFRSSKTCHWMSGCWMHCTCLQLPPITAVYTPSQTHTLLIQLHCFYSKPTY